MLRIIAGRLPEDLRRRPPRLPCAAADFRNQAITLPDQVALALNSSLALDPGARPEMSVIREIIGAELLRDHHSAAFVVQGTLHTLSAGQKAVTITLSNLGVARFNYDGLKFLIAPISGDVFVNNIKITSESTLPKSSVVSFGGPEKGMGRVHVPFDVSHPEVVL